MFLNEFGKFQKKNDSQITKYCMLYQQAISSGNMKKFENQLR